MNCARRSILTLLQAPLFAAIAACASSPNADDPAALTVDEQWLRTACDPAMIDSTGWQRHQLRNVSIAVPISYRPGRSDGFNMRFNRGSAALWLRTGRPSEFSLLRFNQPGQVNCETTFGQQEAEAVMYRSRGVYFVAVHWRYLNEPDDRSSVIATIRATRLEDARALLLSLHTVERTSLPTVQAPNPDAWFHSPCLGDSVDSFEWTRYDLHGIRIRVPRQVKHVKVPNLDELHFRYGSATMRLRLHNDASRWFAQYYTPQRTRKFCSGELGGLAVDVISLGGATDYGFAARWPDADRGEWLALVIEGKRLADVTYLRRTIFTITFPGVRRSWFDSRGD